MVDRVGGISILPELAIQQLSEVQREKVYRFRKPFPYREMSIIYYRPTYKQRIIDEFREFIISALYNKLNYNQNPEDYINIKPQ